MGFTSGGARVWPVPPEWSSGVQEQLRWLTDVLQADASGVTQHRGLRIAPRRSLAFEVLSSGQDRRTAEMLLAGYGGVWDLPIWHDGQRLASGLASGSTSITCTTAGFDFTDGGRALVYESVNKWEVVTTSTVASDHLTLGAATVGTYGTSARLYPLRHALAQDDAKERLGSDDLGRRSFTFDIVEACDWPAIASPTTYLSHPVLDVRPDESDDPTSSFIRLAQGVDYESGLPVVHDLAGVALRTQKSHWRLHGRAEHTWFRSLLYTLQGRRVPIWVPSWTSDLKPTATIAGSSTTLTVEWAGYTLFGLNQPNRRDVRIELVGGTVYYRRITNAVEAGANETLTLSSSLSGSAITASQIRMISFMALSTLSSDEVEIDHETDASGVAKSTTGWKAVVPDV